MKADKTNIPFATILSARSVTQSDFPNSQSKSAVLLLQWMLPGSELDSILAAVFTVRSVEDQEIKSEHFIDG